MSYRVAVTTSDGINIDRHFGRAGDFLVLEVDEATGAWSVLDRREIPGGEPQGEPEFFGGCGQGGGHGRGQGRLQLVAGLLSDCKYLLTERIGQAPVVFLSRHGIAALAAIPDLSAAIEKLNVYHARSARKGGKM
jgi:predicted Fe-Mo cluster-binding NifX family protein